MRFHYVDFENLEETAPLALWRGHDIVFNCIGTTRTGAGGALDFYKVEVEFSQKVARLAKRADITSFSVVTAQGANPNMVRIDFIHPLLYIHTLGMKEEVTKAENFHRLSIFRPGMLNRLKGDRLLENAINYLGFGLPVDTLARS